MGTKSIENHADTRPIPVYIAPMIGESNEISFVDLWRVFVRRKAVFVVSVLLSMLLAFAYLFFAEPVYKAKAYLLPPQHQKIQGLLVSYRGAGYIDADRRTPENVYSAFLNNLNSPGVRRDFFDQHELIKHYAVPEPAKGINADRIFEEFFNERLKVHIDKHNTSFVTVSFSDSDPVIAAQWLNQLLEFANKVTVNQLLSEVESAIQSEIDKARFLLDSKMKVAERRRLDKIVGLKEALRIARALGIHDASTYSKMAERDQSGLVVNTAEVPAYMQGTKALEVQISVLEARKSDEAFIGGFRDLQERQAFLEGISMDAHALSAVTINAIAKTPYRVESPRKLLLILFAAVLGFMIGMFLTFLAEFRWKIQDEREKV